MNKLSILLIEDDQDDIDLMQDTLADNGVDFKMEIIKQGDKVIPYLEMCKNFPDIILLDLNLPKMHGREILERIRSMNDFKHIPVAILTTSSSREDVQFCLKAGASAYLTKPSTVEGFNETIAAILELASRKVEK